MISNSSGKVVWLFGRPSSGKSTLAKGLATRWRQIGQRVKVLDGDELRRGLCADLGYTEADRLENIRRAAEVARLFALEGFHVIAAFITPTAEMRQLVQKILQAETLDFVHVSCSLETCQSRDPKGHYAEAKSGKRPHFTGVGASFESPGTYGCCYIDTNTATVEQCLDQLESALM